MRFSRPIAELIQARHSVRSFDGRAIAPEVVADLLRALGELPAGPFGNRLRFAIVDRIDPARLAGEKLGTYGVIKNAPCFLVGVAPKTPRNMEDFGYVFEHAILAATERALGTCWMAATFDRGAFASAADLKADEIIAAVSPLGHAASSRSFVDATFRFLAGSRKRKPWAALFFEGDFGRPLTEDRAGSYAGPLEMVRLGPSASNKQPWRIVKEPGRLIFHFFIERASSYKAFQSLTAVDLQLLDAGIALCHFELAAREAGLDGTFAARPHGCRELPPRTEYVISWAGSPAVL